MHLSTWTTAAIVVVIATGAHAASPFDGRYSGQSTWAGNGNYSGCSRGNGEVTINVRDGAFNFGPAESRTVVTVGADGTFSGTSGTRFLQGRIQGTQVSGTVVRERCNYIWSLTKQ